MKNHLSYYESYLSGSQGMKRRSVENYVCVIRSFLRWLGKDPDQSNVNDIQEYLVRLKIQGKAINTQRLTVTALKSFFAWHSRQFDKPDPARAIKPIREQIRVPDLPTPDDILKVTMFILELYNKSKNDGRRFTYIRDIALILFLVDSGLRISEALSLRNLHLKRVDDHLQAIVNDSKGYSGRLVNLARLSQDYLVPEMLSYYLLYRQKNLSYRDTDYLFPRSVTDLDKPLNRSTVLLKIINYWRRSGLSSHVTPHTLRHFYGTYSVLNGMDLFSVKANMGHRHLSTTERYIHLAELTRSKAIDYTPGRLLKTPAFTGSGFVNLYKGLNP